jgi:HAD superfamily hydrolase (TIGR01458 family)
MKSDKFSPVLIDLDGVLRIGSKPADDAGEFLEFLSSNGIPSCILSNSSLKTSAMVRSFLNENKIDYGIPAMTAADAALNFVKENYRRVAVYCVEPVKKTFEQYLDDENSEAVVIGDIGDKWSYKIMNDIFVKIYNGADLIALHKNKYWYPDGKTLSLDAGAFINAIEYASSKEAVVIGKPSPVYFKTALKMLGHQDESFLMIGDDIETDILPVRNLGGTGILIYSGKTRYPLPDSLKAAPDYEVHNLKEVIKILDNLFLQKA